MPITLKINKKIKLQKGGAEKCASEGVGIMIDPRRITSAEETHRENPYFIVMHGYRFYSSSPSEIINTLVNLKSTDKNTTDDKDDPKHPGIGSLIDYEKIIKEDPELSTYIVINGNRHYGNNQDGAVKDAIKYYRLNDEEKLTTPLIKDLEKPLGISILIDPNRITSTNEIKRNNSYFIVIDGKRIYDSSPENLINRDILLQKIGERKHLLGDSDWNKSSGIGTLIDINKKEPPYIYIVINGKCFYGNDKVDVVNAAKQYFIENPVISMYARASKFFTRRARNAPVAPATGAPIDPSLINIKVNDGTAAPPNAPSNSTKRTAYQRTMNLFTRKAPAPSNSTKRTAYQRTMNLFTRKAPAPATPTAPATVNATENNVESISPNPYATPATPNAPATENNVKNISPNPYANNANANLSKSSSEEDSASFNNQNAPLEQGRLTPIRAQKSQSSIVRPPPVPNDIPRPPLGPPPPAIRKASQALTRQPELVRAASTVNNQVYENDFEHDTTIYNSP
jgi:hypothetical protein